MKVAVPFAKNILASLGITAVVSAIDPGIHDSGKTNLIISNKKMDDIIKIVQALKDSDILLKAVTKTIKNETKEQIEGFLGILLGTLGASFLGNIWTGKGMLRSGYGNREGKGILRADYRSLINCFWFHPIL